jgi:hypothetical protein
LKTSNFVEVLFALFLHKCAAWRNGLTE